MVLLTIFLKFIVPIMLVLLNLHQFLYNKNPKYYFFFMKRFKKWRDTKWKIHVNIKTINEERIFFDILEQSIDSLFQDTNRVVNMRNKKQYNFGDFSLLAIYDADVSISETKLVDLNFNPMNVTYRSARARLTELRQLFLELEKKMAIEEINYNMDINFSNKINPFFGLMIQRLGKENVDHFECVFDLNTLKKRQTDVSTRRNTNRLRIYKEKITINEKSFDIIEDVAKDILLMG